MTFNRRFDAFTLVELLIVIAILAVLAAIVFTVFAPAKEKARQTHCMNNLKQLGTAVLMYKEDHDGAWPPLTHAVFPQYAGDRAIFVCSDDCTPEKEQRRIEGRYGLYTSYPSGYLPRLSGEDLRRAFEYGNCDEMCAALAGQEFLAKTPILVCRRHLLPGADPQSHEFEEELAAAQVQAPILKLNQDGSVVLWMVPADTGGYMWANSTMGVGGYTINEWAAAMGRARKELHRRGLCLGEEEE